MAIESLFERASIYPCRIGDLTFNQISEVQVSPSVSKHEITPGGAIDRAHIATAYAEPTVKVTTGDFDNVFPSVSAATGYSSDTQAIAPTAASIFQYQRRIDGGIFDAVGNATHHVLTGGKGFTLIESIRAEQDSLEGAQCDLMHYALSLDGQEEPLIHTNDALALTPTFHNTYHLGPVWIGASEAQWYGIQSVSVRPGLVYQVKRGSGCPFASIGSIVARNPEISIRLNDMDNGWTRDAMDNLFHNAVTGSTSINVFLWRSEHGGARRPQGNAEHIRIKGTYGEEDAESISVSRIDDATLELKFRITAASLTVTEAVALP